MCDRQSPTYLCMLSAQVPVLESGRNDESWVDAEVRGLGIGVGGGRVSWSSPGDKSGEQAHRKACE